MYSKVVLCAAAILGFATVSATQQIEVEETPKLEGPGNLMSINYPGNLVDLTGYFKVDYILDFDAYWGTGYQAGPYSQAGVPDASKFNFEKYWLHLVALGQASLTVEVLSFYKINIIGFLEPFTVRPVEGWLLFYRPEQGALQDFDIGLKLTSFFNMAKTYVKVQEQGKVTIKSISKYLLDGTTLPYPTGLADFAYNALMSAQYLDQFYQYNFIDNIFPNFSASTYYGQTELFSMWLFSNYNF